jgi:hypothetical protein
MIQDFCCVCQAEHVMAVDCLRKARKRRAETTSFINQEVKIGKKVANLISINTNSLKKVKKLSSKNQQLKGKTYRKAHYNPQVKTKEEASAILAKRQINDSKPGGRSRSRGWRRMETMRLGSERGTPNMARPWSFNLRDQEQSTGLVNF